MAGFQETQHKHLTLLEYFLFFFLVLISLFISDQATKKLLSLQQVHSPFHVPAPFSKIGCWRMSG